MNRIFFAIGVLLLSALLGCAGAGVRPGAPGVKHTNVLVHPFEYKGSGEYAWISAGMCDSLISDLSGIAGMNVFTEHDRVEALKEIQLGMTGLIGERDSIRVGRLMGASIILTGSLQVEGRAIRINARLVKVESAEVLRAVKIDGELGHIFELQDRLVRALATGSDAGQPGAFGLGIRPADLTRLSEAARPASDAYAWYAKGLAVHYTRLEQARGYYLKAIGLDASYVAALNKLGDLCKELNRFDEALRYHETASSVLAGRGMGKSEAYAGTLQHLGAVALARGDYTGALAHFDRAQKLRESIGHADFIGYAETLGDIGSAYLKKGNADTALSYYSKSRARYNALGMGDTIDTVTLTSNIGTVYFTKGNRSGALAHYRQALDSLKKIGIGETKHSAVLHSNIGSLSLAQGDTDAALKQFTEARAIWNRLGLAGTYNYAMTVSNIGALYLKRGEACTGLPYFEEALAVYQRVGRADLAGPVRNMTSGLRMKCRGR